MLSARLPAWRVATLEVDLRAEGVGELWGDGEGDTNALDERDRLRPAGDHEREHSARSERQIARCDGRIWKHGLADGRYRMAGGVPHMKARTLFAEGLGTALLVFFGAGTATLTFGFKIAGTSPSAGVVATALAFGLVLLVLVYGIGPISDCHVNPAVTVGFLAARRISLVDALGYWGAQLVGGIAGAAGLYGIVHTASSYHASLGLGADTFRIRRQLAGTSGLVAYGLRAHLAAKTFWTFSIWDDHAGLDAFADSDPHRRITQRLKPRMGERHFEFFPITGSEHPWRWERITTALGVG